MVAPEAVAGDSEAAVCARNGLKLACASGKYLPSCAYTACCAARSVAMADCRLGLLAIARSISALSAGDLNTAHHSLGISRPAMKRWLWPAAASADDVRGASGSRV